MARAAKACSAFADVVLSAEVSVRRCIFVFSSWTLLSVGFRGLWVRAKPALPICNGGDGRKLRDLLSCEAMKFVVFFFF